MWSLRPAARTCVLGALAGVAVTAGCGRPNPGFQLKDTADGQETSSTHGSVSESSTGPAPMTSSSTTSTEPPTTGGPGVSGSETSSSTSDASVSTTTGESSDTSGAVEPCDPQNPKVARVVPTADGYFFNIYEQGLPYCGFNADPLSETMDCIDLDAGAAPMMPLVYDNLGDVDVTNDSMSIFGMHFPALADVLELPVKVTIFDAWLELHFVRTAKGAWGPPKFQVYSMGSSLWIEGDNKQVDGCPAGAASFRCRICGPTPETVDCAGWPGNDGLYPQGNKSLGSFDLGAVAPELDVDLPYTFPLGLPGVELAVSEGLMVVATHKLIWNDGVNVYSKESDKETQPVLVVSYCPK